MDDDPHTRWATADETRACWLEVDLLQPERFGKVAISELQRRITKFQLEYRNSEQEPWQIALAGAGAGTAYEKTFPPVTARLVRLHILDATFAPTIWEFGLYAP